MKKITIILFLLTSLNSLCQVEYGVGYNLGLKQMPIGFTLYSKSENVGAFIDFSSSGKALFSDERNTSQLTLNLNIVAIKSDKIQISPYIGSGITVYKNNSSLNTTFGLILESDGTIYGIGYSSNPQCLSLRIGFYF